MNRMLKFFGIAKSSYFYEIGTYGREEDSDASLKESIRSIFGRNKGRYGYRRITLELNGNGVKVNHKRVKRIMSDLGLYGIQPRAKYRSYKGEVGKTCKNLLLEVEVDETKHTTTYKRNFATTACNQKWTTDVSEFRIASGKLYLSPILDMHNREIVSYSISYRPDYNQTKDMLSKAFSKYDSLEGLILHSDQGWQYQMEHYRKTLKDKGIIQSMSRKGNCLDNSLMENFFGIMKNEMFYGHEHEFSSLEELKKAMEEYIEYYNKERITVKLKGLSPTQRRQQSSNNL